MGSLAGYVSEIHRSIFSGPPCIQQEQLILIILKIQILSNGPCAELIKQNEAASIFINLLKLLLGVNLAHPLLYHILVFCELGQLYPVVAACIRSAERHVVFKVLP